MPVSVLFIRALHASIERHWFRSSRLFENKCAFWIASIFSWTCSELLEGPMEMESRERQIGSTLAHFDHVIRTQSRVVGVVHARRSIERGILHAHTSCNFLLLTEGLDVMHAIVTDFVTWGFIRYNGDTMYHRVVYMEPSGSAGISTIEELVMLVGLICDLAQD